MVTIQKPYQSTFKDYENTDDGDDTNELYGAVTVMKYDDVTGWELVGNRGLNGIDAYNEGASDITLKLYDGTPYVAFTDNYYDSNVGDSLGNKATVMKYNGTDWEPVGDRGFSADAVCYTQLYMYDGIPYVAFTEEGASGSFPTDVTVMKYVDVTGWVLVGDEYFTDQGPRSMALAVDEGRPYVAFMDNPGGAQAWRFIRSANAGNNTVSADPDSVLIGSPVTLTMYGDLQETEEGLVYGDERYVPIGWSSDDGESGDLTSSYNNGDFSCTGTYTPVSSGSRTITITYQLQMWGSEGWEPTEFTATKTTTVTVGEPNMANADENEVSASPSSVTAGSSVTLSASGDRQETVMGVVYGDERYIPIDWSSTETGKSGSFTYNDGDTGCDDTYTPSTAGSYTITANFQLQTWNESEWVDSGSTDTKTTTVTVTAAAHRSGGNGGGSTPAPTPAPAPVPTKSGVEVLVNGKAENAGTATQGTQGSQTLTNVTVDEKKLEAKIQSEGDNAVITIPINTKSDIVIGELNGQMVKDMEARQNTLEIRTETASYFLPAQQINIDAVSAQVGQSVQLKDIKIQLEIAKSNTDTVKVVEDSAQKGSFSIVIPPMDFTVKGSYGGKVVDVSKFNIYVERRIAIPDGVDPSKITTGVITEADGTSRHVPTQVIKIDGKYYAEINSLTNSTYTVVWHPMEFTDVANNWAKTEINDMGSRMVVSGAGNDMYLPDRDITRAEFAAIIVRALGLKPGEGSSSFTDVAGSAWYSDYIKTATEYKIINGYGNGKFGPLDKITREQAMTMVARAMNITGLKSGLASGDVEKLITGFNDGIKAADYAKTNIAACVKTGIVAGRGNNLVAPKANITRAEVAVIVRRLLQKSKLI